MSANTRKSSSENRLDAIVQALVQANEKAKVLSKCRLSRMPEYFMVCEVADYFAKHFKNFGYRLEASVKGTLADAGVAEKQIDQLLRREELRGNGRFDLVVRTGRRGVPAHVVEFKRGSRHQHLLKDLIRLAYVCESVGERTRLETNYLVFTTSQTREQLCKMLHEQERERPKQSVDKGVRYTLARYQQIDHWMNPSFEMTSKPLAVAVFEVRFKA